MPVLNDQNDFVLDLRISIIGTYFGFGACYLVIIFLHAKSENFLLTLLKINPQNLSPPLVGGDQGEGD